MRVALLRLVLLATLIFPKPSNAQRLAVITPIRTAVTSSAEDRNELASELVVMIYAAGESGENLLGAATVMGANRDCLYLATADHVARDEKGRARSLSAHTRWRTETTPVRVLDVHDPGADLAALCLPRPDLFLIPFPRIPYFIRGDTTQLVKGNAMTFFGAGNTFEWHTKSAIMTYASKKGNTLVARGAGVEQGDSGGAVFLQQDVFNTLVGMILRTNQGEMFALSIDYVAQRFRDWRLAVDLESWNFRDASAIGVQQYEEGSLQGGMESPPISGSFSERLKRLAVGITGGPPGRTTGLLVGATENAVWVQVPWEAPKEKTVPRLRFATGFEVDGSYIPDRASSNDSILMAVVPRAELVKLEVAAEPGFTLDPLNLSESPLRVPFMVPTDLVAGTTSFLLGVESNGTWTISPRDLTIERVEGGKIRLRGGAIDPTWIGWLAFDDRNRLMGFVAGAHDSWFDLIAIRDLVSRTVIPSNAAHLRSWHPLKVATPLSVGGAAANCPVAQAIGYGRREEASDLMLIPDGLLIGGRTFTSDFNETEAFTRSSTAGQTSMRYVAHRS